MKIFVRFAIAACTSPLESAWDNNDGHNYRCVNMNGWTCGGDALLTCGDSGCAPSPAP